MIQGPEPGVQVDIKRPTIFLIHLCIMLQSLCICVLFLAAFITILKVKDQWGPEGRLKKQNKCKTG